ncbi:MAG: GNAT family N-acetyltransferase [Nostoc sp. NMS7]|uniref:GNAT family N-acetyltransferase n=1 Tax=Nostoc sp. NMS7 TaxID=2815391 RepID=UPI0025FAC056|nr:GNAT family N-acetyltransferase [Nostoc sp. NMS7]MBN3949364.1 GNAT family N-acetyltransferase [Nostoc sp. NMS7]
MEKRYTDGISGFKNVKVQGSKIEGIFYDIVSPSLTKSFNFTIDSDTGDVDYTQIDTPVNPASFSEYEFAAPGSKSKQCKEGKSSACTRPDSSVYCIKIGYKCKSLGLSAEEKAVVKAIAERGGTHIVEKGKDKKTPDTKVQIPSQVGDILSRKTVDALELPNTATSRVEGLARFTGDKKEADNIIQDNVLLKHLDTAGSVRDVSPLGKKFAETADEEALKIYKIASEDKKNELSDPRSPNAFQKDILEKYANNSKSKAAKAIAQDLLKRRDKFEKEMEAKDRQKNSKSSDSGTSSGIDDLLTTGGNQNSVKTPSNSLSSSNSEVVNDPGKLKELAKKWNSGISDLKAAYSDIQSDKPVSNKNPYNGLSKQQIEDSFGVAEFLHDYAKGTKNSFQAATSDETNARNKNLAGVVDSSGNLQALYKYKISKDHVFVTDLATSPDNLLKSDKSVKGAGRMAILDAVKKSKQSGFDGRVELIAVEGAIPFYKKMGFEVKSGDKYMVLMPENAKNLFKNLGEKW